LVKVSDQPWNASNSTALRDKDLHLRAYFDVWWPLARHDAAGCHIIICNASKYSDYLRGACKLEDRRTIAHYAAATNIVASRLVDFKEGTSDGTISAVLAFASYDVSLIRMTDFTNFKASKPKL
jgi:hypothetical protein